MKRRVFVWLWPLLFLCLGAVNAHNLDGHYLLQGEKTPRQFSGKGSLQEALQEIDRGHKLKMVQAIQIDKGYFTDADWNYLWNCYHGKDASKRMDKLTSLVFLPTVTWVAEAPAHAGNGKWKGRLVPELRTARLAKLKEVGQGTFALSKVLNLEMPDLERAKSQAFMLGDVFEEVNFPKLKELGEKCFWESRFLRKLTTPSLQKMHGDGTFAGCKSFSLWKLGAQVPQGADESDFVGCPENRYIVLVDASGEPLTGSALHTALARYKSDRGWNNATQKWFGWSLGGSYKKITVLTTTEVSANTQPVEMCQSGQEVVVDTWPKQFYRVSQVTVEWKEGGQTKRQSIDVNQKPLKFTMPNADATVRVETVRTNLKIRIDDKWTVEGQGLGDAKYVASRDYNDSKDIRMRKLELLDGWFTEQDWQHFGQPILAEFIIHPKMNWVAEPPDRQVNGPGKYWFFTRSMAHVRLSKVHHLPRHFLRAGNDSVSWVEAPDVTHIDHYAFEELKAKNGYMALALNGKRNPPTTGQEPFWEVVKPRFLMLMDAKGEKMLEGHELDEAKKKFLAVDDGNKHDREWFGWLVDFYRVTCLSSQHGKVWVKQPMHGCALQGHEIYLSTTPEAGYKMRAGSLKWRKKGSQDNWNTVDGKTMMFTMPAYDVEVKAEFDLMALHVVIDPEIEHGTITAAPNDGLRVGQEVRLTVEPHAGYSLVGSSLYYQKENDLNAPKVSIDPSTLRFNMPDYDVKIFAEFKGELYKVTVCSGIKDGTIFTVPKDKAVAGSVVAVLNQPKSQDYRLDAGSLMLTNKKTGVKTPIVNSQFQMPLADVEVCGKFEKFKYGTLAVIVDPTLRHGSIVAQPNNNVAEGTTVHLTVTPYEGYDLRANTLKWQKLNSQSWTNVTGTSFTMPNASVLVTCEFTPRQYQIVVLPSEHGKIHATPHQNVATDTDVQVSVEPQAGYRLKPGSLAYRKKGTTQWVSIVDRHFYMPASDVEIQAEFETDPGFKGYRVMVASDVKYGVLEAKPSEGLKGGETVTVTDKPYPGYSLVPGSLKWRELPDGEWKAIAGNTFQMPAADVEITAQFATVNLHVTWDNNIANGSISAAPHDNVVVGQRITVTVNPEAGYALVPSAFYYQKENEPNAPKVPIDAASKVFEMPGYSVKVFAQFAGKEYKITICNSLQHGRLATIPADRAAKGSTVAVLSSPESNYVLVEGSLEYRPNGGSPVKIQGASFVMPEANVEVCGKFEARQSGTLFVFIDPNTAKMGRIVAVPNENLNIGQRVSITVTPNPGYKFKDGTLTYTPLGGGGVPAPITGNAFNMPNKSVMVTGQFEALSIYNVFVKPTEHGKVTATPNVNVSTDQTVQLSIQPEAGYRLKAGSLKYIKHDNGTEFVPITAQSFSMPPFDVDVFAEFEEDPDQIGKVGHWVKVADGVQHGTLVATPSNDVKRGTTVKVEAKPAAGYTLRAGTVEWHTVPNGIWQAVQNDEFVMPFANVEVRAEFEATSLHVTCDNVEHGTLAANPNTNVTVGERIRVTVDPEMGYKLVPNSLYYQEEGNAAGPHVLIDETSREFVMPGYSVKVFAKFSGQTFQVTVCPNIQHGTLKTIPANSAVASSTVNVVAEPQMGYVVKPGSLQYTPAGASEPRKIQNNAFTMPEANVEVCVEFAPPSFGNLSVVVDPTVKHGTIVAIPNSGLAIGAEVTIQIEPHRGYKFKEGSLKYQILNDVRWLEITDQKFNMPDYSVMVRGEFIPLKYNITVLPSVNGKVEAKPTTDVPTDLEVELKITPEEGYRLASLQYRETGTTGPWIPIAGTRFAMPPHHIDIEAKFEYDTNQTGHRVLVAPGLEHGTLEPHPSRNVKMGEIVAVVVKPDIDFEVVESSLEYRVLPSGDWEPMQGRTFTMPDADAEIRAKFSGEGNRVTFDPNIQHGRLSANRTLNVPLDFVVKISYQADPQWDLDKESVKYRILPDGDWFPVQSLRFLMPDASVEVTGVFVPAGNSVYQHKDVVHGKIVATPWANVPEGTDVVLDVQPDPGYSYDPTSLKMSRRFKDEWVPVDNATKTFKMPNYSVDVTAVFAPIEYKVTVEPGISGGVLIPTPTTASVGTTIGVDYTCDAGYELVSGSLAYRRQDSQEWIPILDGRFLMPASDVVVRGSFSRVSNELFDVNIIVQGEGRLEVYSGTDLINDGMKVPGGTRLTINRLPNKGWELARLTINEETFNDSVYVVRSSTEIKALFSEDNLSAVESTHALDVYPNPFTGELRIETTDAVEVHIFTMVGQEVYHAPLVNKQLQLGSLPAGVYVLRVKYADGTYAIRRIVKQ